MSFGEAVSHAFSNYVNFNGRARRSEYWYFCLFNIIILTVLGIFSGIGPLSGFFATITSIYSLAVFLPGLSVLVRRLHDIGKSWVWMLIGFVPLVGEILLLVWMCTDSNPGTNAYGPCPK